MEQMKKKRVVVEDGAKEKEREKRNKKQQKHTMPIKNRITDTHFDCSSVWFGFDFDLSVCGDVSVRECL